MIQWQAPEEEHRNGLVAGYVVRYRLHGYGDHSPWSYRNITNEVLLLISLIALRCHRNMFRLIKIRINETI